MLFLAVFLGFVAENIREGSVERLREKEYMVSMIADIKRDIAALEGAKLKSVRVLGAIDTTLQILNKEILSEDEIKSLYRLNTKNFRIVTIEFDERTSSQLKNAGGMRLIKNKQVLDSLSIYWEAQQSIAIIAANLKSYTDKAEDLSQNIFDRRNYSETETPFDAAVKPHPKLMRNGIELLPEFSNRLEKVYQITKNHMRFIKNQTSLALGLINVIKKEYNLKEE